MKIILLVCVIAVMVMIFLFSRDTGAVSGDRSGRISELLVKLFFPSADTLSGEEYVALRGNVDLFVRKVAHFSEFAMLSFFSSLFLSMFTKKRSVIYISAVVFSALYAAFDEIHQLYVSGRDGNITDVLIDTCGALAGAGVTLLVLFLISKFNKKTRSEGSE